MFAPCKMVRVQWHTVTPSHSMSPSLSLSLSLCVSMPAFTDSRWKWHHKNKTQQIMCKHSFSIFNSYTLAIAFNSLSSLLMLVCYFFPFSLLNSCCWLLLLFPISSNEKLSVRKQQKKNKIYETFSHYSMRIHIQHTSTQLAKSIQMLSVHPLKLFG